VTTATIALVVISMMPSIVAVDAGSANATSLDVEGLRISHLHFRRGRLESHYHERACLSVILDGGFTETFGGRAIECTPGSTLIKPAGERHRDVFHGSRQIVIEPENDAAVPRTGRSLFGEIAHIRSVVVEAIGSRIAHELQNVDAWTPLAIEGLTLELFAATRRAQHGGPIRGALPRWLARVHERLIGDPTPPRVGELAALADVHPVYLGRVFRHHFGMSMGAYARRLRLEWAAQQLSQTSDPLSRIACRAGFADQSHFTREFRRYSGVTPRQYRLATLR
jgi:AraC-like DNA-binding protein/mannose-6-phosphate isomerase-like protein (cupin superfamily)